MYRSTSDVHVGYRAQHLHLIGGRGVTRLQPCSENFVSLLRLFHDFLNPACNSIYGTYLACHYFIYRMALQRTSTPPNSGPSPYARKSNEETRQQSSQWNIWVCVATVLVLNLSFYSMGAPSVRIMELAVCREYYSAHDPKVIQNNGDIDEHLCKLDSIQKKTAWLLMGNQLLGFLGGT